MQSKYRQKNIM